MFPTLKQLEADEIYDKAIQHIKKHGFSNHATYDPYTKEIDIWGAILLACGAKEKLLAEGLSNAEIARKRFVTEKAIEVTIARLAKKFDIPYDAASNQRVVLAKKVFAMMGKSNDLE